MAEIGGIAAIADSSSRPAAAPPPPPQRRPRVREVSSRFMSPVATPSSSSSCSDLHLVTAKSPHHKQQQQQQRHRRLQYNKDTESLMSADENRPIETARSLESPFQFQSRKDSFQRREQQPRSVMKLFSETSKITGRYNNSSRPDTPRVTNSSPSRPRTLQRSTSNTATAATKLLQSISTQLSSASAQDDTSSNVDDSDIDTRSCSSDKSEVSARTLTERNVNNGINLPVTPCCSRSLHLQLHNSQNPFFSSIKGSEKPTPALSRSFSNSAKIPPPVPPTQGKPGTDARKGKKVPSYQEDAHSLKLLQNHFLQWRFANAKAEASIRAQTRETEKSLYSLGIKLSELNDSVKRKRIELEILKRMRSISTILDAQMPYLEEWSAFEDDYSNCLSEAIQALLNTSIQLPIGGDVRADVMEMGEALNSAAKVMEVIIIHLQSLMPKAEEVEILISELAKVTGGEIILVEECGGLLSKMHRFQVRECSLRGELMQLRRGFAVAGRFQQYTNNSSPTAVVHMR